MFGLSVTIFCVLIALVFVCLPLSAIYPGLRLADFSGCIRFDSFLVSLPEAVCFTGAALARWVVHP